MSGEEKQEEIPCEQSEEEKSMQKSEDNTEQENEAAKSREEQKNDAAGEREPEPIESTKSTERTDPVEAIDKSESEVGCPVEGSKEESEDIKNKTEQESVGYTAASASAPITTVDDQAVALYAHNTIRKLHGVNVLAWDSGLAEKATKWAVHLAETDKGLEHSSPLKGYGENLYISKGTSKAARTYQAVLQWYKTISQYSFKCPGFTLNTGTFTQMLWDETQNLGVGVAYREDTKTTYIVAQYSPPGNGRYAESYIEHVKPPLTGLPPRIPKIEDLVSGSVGGEKSLSNMQSLFDVLCHWCISDGEKPIESFSGAQPLPPEGDSEESAAKT